MDGWLKLLVATACMGVAGCNTIENQYVDANGRRGSGQTTFGVTMTDGKFAIADAGVTCSGTFPHWRNATVVFPVTCTDGTSGTVTMTRPTANASMVAGEGTMSLTNGDARRFVFGRKDMMG
ncbi:hypothetical protein FB001_103289 [Ensifer sp. SEMIA 135]|nr:hypothetical protein FB000_10438 [Ensifer sp. SEMIA 134]TWB39501.1 hypothetical protein FB001_103289 [Ensifer sp. SEMIA 135]